MSTERKSKDTAPDSKIKDASGSPQYPAEYFLNRCNWYSHRRGELVKLLDKDKKYSYSQIEQILSSGA